MPVRIAGDRRTGAARKAAETEEEQGGLFDRKVEIGPFAPAIAMADDQPTADSARARQQQPAADREIVGRPIIQVVDAPFHLARWPFDELRRRIDAECPGIARAPEIVETGWRLGRPQCLELIEPETGGRIELVRILGRNVHAVLLGPVCSVEQAIPQACALW